MRISDWSSDVCSSDLQADVDLAAMDEIDHLAAVHRSDQVQLDRGMFSAQASCKVHDGIGPAGAVVGQPDLTDVPLRSLFRPHRRQVRGLNGTACLRQECPAGSAQLLASRVAVAPPLTDLAPSALDLLGPRWLRDQQPLLRQSEDPLLTKQDR